MGFCALAHRSVFFKSTAVVLQLYYLDRQRLIYLGLAMSVVVILVAIHFIYTTRRFKRQWERSSK